MNSAESSAFTTCHGSKFISKNDAISRSPAPCSVCAPAQAGFHASCFSRTGQPRAKAASDGFTDSRAQCGRSAHAAATSLPR